MSYSTTFALTHCCQKLHIFYVETLTKQCMYYIVQQNGMIFIFEIVLKYATIDKYYICKKVSFFMVEWCQITQQLQHRVVV